MPIVSVDVPSEIDGKINVMKATKNVRSKEKMIIDILDEYFKNIDSMERFNNTINDLKTKVEAQNKVIEGFKIDM